jgi:Domain of unknown function (DUF1835)
MSNQRKPISDGRLNFEQQKKLAKDLLSEYKSNTELALRRFQQNHPKASNIKEFAALQPKLSDAQLVIARENGLPSWTKLKQHIQCIEQASRDIARGMTTAFDADFKTLHLRCGSDIQHKLVTAGFSGDFLEFADPYCQGAVPPDSDLSRFLSIRANFISQAYGITLKDARNRLKREYSQLHRSHQYERVVLWFEHDSYDQFILAYVLHHFWKTQLFPQRLELICIDSFPGIKRFVGLGHLSPEVLRTLWEQRRPLTRQDFQLGHQVWKALTASSPEALIQIINAETLEIPTMAKALRRHLQELPWVNNGLSLTQQLTLEILADEGTITAGKLFGNLVVEKEPLPYLGDTMYWYILTELLQSKHPPIELIPETTEQPWNQRLIKLTDTGRALVKEEVNWLQLNNINRWVGGIHLIAGQPLWMWSSQRNQPVLQQI